MMVWVAVPEDERAKIKCSHTYKLIVRFLLETNSSEENNVLISNVIDQSLYHCQVAVILDGLIVHCFNRLSYLSCYTNYRGAI